MDRMKKILLVDDDTIEHLKVTRAFKKLDIENPLAFAKDGVEALDYLKQTKEFPGLILLDLNMPNMNGLEFLSAVKSNEKFKVIPVVVLTTSNNEQDRIQSYNHSVAGYMLKPIRLEDYEYVFKTIEQYWTLSKTPY